MNFEHGLVKMKNQKPFNITIFSVEPGFEVSVCIKCKNEKEEIKFDSIKIKQKIMPLDCKESLSVLPIAELSKNQNLKFSNIVATLPVGKFFKNEKKLCSITTCDIMELGRQ